MAVVYWSARLAVNEEVRVRSPPVTQQLGVGQWLATWPGTRSTQVRFLPPRQSCRHPSRALTNGRQPVPKTGVVVMSPRGSIPPLSSRFFVTALSANGRRPGPHPGNGGFNSPQRHARPLRLHGKASRLSIGRRGFESRSGRHAHGNWIAASATNAGSGGSSPLVGTPFIDIGDVLEW